MGEASVELEKLNIDGFLFNLEPRGWLGGGNIFRDDSNFGIGGFSRKIGTATSFLVELWALRDGLLMCQTSI